MLYFVVGLSIGFTFGFYVGCSWICHVYMLNCKHGKEIIEEDEV